MTGRPAALSLPTPPPAGTVAVVQYTSAEAQAPELNVRVERQLNRLVKAPKTDQESEGSGWTAQIVAENEPLSTDELYLDDVAVTAAGKPQRYGLLEVALPPGAVVESTTWGINLPGDKDKLVGLERARHQNTSFGYAVPVDPIAGTQHVRHLLRFGEKGTFHVPRARFYRMYLPEAKAFEDGDGPHSMVVQ
jgi:uncharacterized protein YfaS (alpha-2-macroglobulin family)